MKLFNMRALFFVLSLLAYAGFGVEAMAQNNLGYSVKNIAGSCPDTRGVADLKETAEGWGAQYWINGFPGVNPSCKYTLALCYNGSGREKGATVFIVTANGQKLKSQDHLLNCSAGWSFYFRGVVAGAQEILLSTERGISISVGFAGESTR